MATALFDFDFNSEDNTNLSGRNKDLGQMSANHHGWSLTRKTVLKKTDVMSCV